MAKGNWRNWDEISCSGPKCDNIIYIKDAVKKDGKYYCLFCINFMKMVSRANRTRGRDKG